MISEVVKRLGIGDRIESSIIGELCKSYIVEDDQDRWFADFIDSASIRRYRQESVFLFKTTLPRLFSATNKYRRFFIFADARYFHYQLAFFTYFQEVFSISAHGNQQILAGRPRDEFRTEVAAVMCIFKLAINYIAENICNPYYRRADIAITLPVGSDGEKVPSAGWRVPLQSSDCYDVQALLSGFHLRTTLSSKEKDVINLSLFHECAHVLLNGFSTSAECGRMAVRDAQKFFREHLEGSAEDPSVIFAALDRAMEADDCLDEINADCLALDHLLANYLLSDITPQFVEDLIVKQFSLLVGATLFGGLNMQMDAFSKGIPLPSSERMQVEGMARTYVAISRIIKFGGSYIALNYNYSKPESDQLTVELVECFFHVNNGSRYIEEVIKTGWAMNMLEDADQYVKSEEFMRRLAPGVRALSAGERNLKFALPVLSSLGWPVQIDSSITARQPEGQQ